MVRAAARIHRYCRERAGDELRGVVSYGPEGDRVVYLREDIAGKADPNELTSTMDRARQFHETVATVGQLQPTLGGPQASVNLFEGAIVMHLYQSESSGVILTFERSVGRELTSFVATLLDILHGDVEGDGEVVTD